MKSHELESTTEFLSGPAGFATSEDRYDQALMEAALAREADNVDALAAVFDRYPDLRTELLEDLGLEEYFHIPPKDPLAFLPPGPPVRERYEIMRQIGEGSYGRVLMARERGLGRLVALKVFKLDLEDRAALIRFLDEPQVTSQLDHPGVPAVHAMGKMEDGRPYVAMRLIEGVNLRDRLKETPVPPVPELLAIFRTVCQIIAYAHQRGVVHRDLKPANIMIGRFGEVQVLDWGLNRVLLSGEEPPRTLRQAAAELLAPLTQDGARLGTPSYMPPEQAITTGRATVASDVFALGAILCEILTGKPPYTPDDGTDVLRSIERADRTEADKRLDACKADPALVALVRHCLVRHPEARPPASEVAEQIKLYLDALEEQATEQRAAAARARLRSIVIALAATIVVGASGVAAWIYTDRAERRAAEHTRLAVEAAKAEARHGQAARWLDQTEESLAAGALAKAASSLAQAQGRLTENDDPAGQQRARELDECLIFARRCDEIRQRQDTDDAEVAYAGAFHRLGLDLPDGDDVAGFGEAVRASPVRNQILAALDHWEILAGDPGMRRRLLRLARAAAGGNADEWKQRFRSEAIRWNARSLTQLADETAPESRTAAELDVLARAMASAGVDPIPLLRRGLVAHPDDFWLHRSLSNALQRSRSTQQALAEAQIALALRPDSFETREAVSQLLVETGQPDRALPEIRWTIARKPSIKAYRLLIRSLVQTGDLVSAENACLEGRRLFGDAAADRNQLESIRLRLRSVDKK